MKLKILAIFVLILIMSSIRFSAAGGIGTTMFQVLQMPVNAYDAALANTSISGVNSAVSTPSLIPFLSRSFMFTHVAYLENIKYSVADLNIPFDKKSGLNVSFCYLDFGKMDRISEDLSGGYIFDGSFEANDKVFNISYGRRITENFSTGAGFKYIKQTIDNVSYDGFAGHLSGLCFLSNNLFCVVGINNLGPDINGYHLPSNLYCGLSGDLNETTVFAVQLDNFYNDDICDIKFASEFSFEKKLFLRIGYVVPIKKYNGTNDGVLTNLTGGVGLNFKILSIDYAWLPKGDLGNAHMFSILIKF